MGYQRVENWRQRPELKKLLDLSDPPKELFYRGEWETETFKDCVAVVGSRRMTDYGRRVIEKIIPQLVLAGKTIVSGFMYGVDQHAQKVCVESGGRTIAVLGWGIGVKLLEEEERLARMIVSSGGLLISEWESQKGALWTFPVRNRIVAALSGEVIVVEAGVNSGSLITARLAGGLGRKVWAVPGPITSRVSEGTNNLIAGRKAEMWLGSGSPMALLRQKYDDPILDVLVNESLTADEMARKLGKSVVEIGSWLSLALLSGKVGEKGGKYYLEDAG